MSNATSSADPHALWRYQRAAEARSQQLLAEADRLAAALEAFQATCTEYALGIDAGLAAPLRTHARRDQALGEWVGRIGAAFARADQGEGGGVLGAGAAVAPAASVPVDAVPPATDWLLGQAAHRAWQAVRAVQTQWGLGGRTGAAPDWRSAAQDWLAQAGRWAEQTWTRLYAQARALTQAGLLVVQAGLRAAEQYGPQALEWTLKQLGNLLWGAIWGETWFADVWGAEVAALIGDVIAGVFVVGDIRDVIKYWIVQPLRGEGDAAFNAALGGVALLGVIPGGGDLAKTVVKHTLKRLYKIVGPELLKRALQEVDAATVTRLVVRLGEDDAVRLLRALEPGAVQRLTEALSPDEIAAVLATADPAALAALANRLTVNELRALATLLAQGVPSADAIKLLESAQQAGVLDGMITLVHTGAVQRLIIKDRKDAQAIVSDIEKIVSPAKEPGTALAKELEKKRIEIYGGMLTADKEIKPHVALNAVQLVHQIDEMVSKKDRIKTLTGLDGQTKSVTATVHGLVTSGELYNIRGFRDFLDKVKKEIEKKDQIGLLTQLEEAAQRARNGHHVALEEWGGEFKDGRKQEGGHGDVIDITAREAIEMKVVTSTDLSAVVTNIQKAAEQLRSKDKPPPGFARIIDVRVLTPDNPIAQATSDAELLATLRAHGLRPDDLAGVDELRLTTPHGPWTITPAALSPGSSAGP